MIPKEAIKAKHHGQVLCIIERNFLLDLEEVLYNKKRKCIRVIRYIIGFMRGEGAGFAI